MTPLRLARINLFSLRFHNRHKNRPSHLDRQWKTIGHPSQAQKCIFFFEKEGPRGTPFAFKSPKAKDLERPKINGTAFKKVDKKIDLDGSILVQILRCLGF